MIFINDQELELLSSPLLFGPVYKLFAKNTYQMYTPGGPLGYNVVFLASLLFLLVMIIHKWVSYFLFLKTLIHFCPLYLSLSFSSLGLSGLEDICALKSTVYT